jgi:hypothetical protein
MWALVPPEIEYTHTPVTAGGRDLASMVAVSSSSSRPSTRITPY